MCVVQLIQRFIPKYKSNIVALLLLIAAPSFATDGDLTLSAERRMGDGIARQIFRDPDYIDDPLLQEYVEGIWQSLLKSSRDKGELSPEMLDRFAWRVMLGRDRTVNAFALPGGYFGVHLGLIGLTVNRDELASVLAHELSHVTQRHISRSIAQQGRQTPLILAAMVLGALVAKSNPDVAGAVITGSQAVAMQSQLNYSRDMEREADRIGYSLMQPAGFAPEGFVGMFNLLQQSARLSDNGSYPYLRTHPLTTERIGDMQARVQSAGLSGKDDASVNSVNNNANNSNNANDTALLTMLHAMMAARARVLSDPGVDVLRLWAAEPQKGGAAGFAALPPARQASVLYAAILACMKLRDFDRAKNYINRLKTLTDPNLNASRVTKLVAAELSFVEGNAQPALQLDASTTGSGRLLRPELFIASTAQIAQVDRKQVDLASQNLRTWVAAHPLDAPAWQLLASAYTKLGESLRATRAEAEAQVAVLDYAAAVDRFRAAQELVRSGKVAGEASKNRDFHRRIDCGRAHAPSATAAERAA